MEKRVFKLYSKYYNLFYADKPYSAEVDYIDRVLKTYAKNAKSILEYGSGTGGHGLLLQKKGYSLVGIEQSSDMATIAKAKGYNCHVGNIVDLELEEKFDGCIALFHVISYVNSNEDLIKLFTKTRRNLKEKGIFVFDIWFSPAVLHQMPEVRVKKVADGEVSITRIAEPSLDFVKNTVNVHYHILVKNKADGQYEEFTEAHSMRHFGYPEIDLLASRTGFSIVNAEEFLTGKAPSVDTWGVNFVLQAN